MRTFQSTPSVGRATIVIDLIGFSTAISIHALRGEGDDKFNKCSAVKTDISIHALRGEGDVLYVLSLVDEYNYFNPRPPWGGRPNMYHLFCIILADFNPRPPWGGRR